MHAQAVLKNGILCSIFSFLKSSFFYNLPAPETDIIICLNNLPLGSLYFVLKDYFRHAVVRSYFRCAVLRSYLKHAVSRSYFRHVVLWSNLMHAVLRSYFRRAAVTLNVKSLGVTLDIVLRSYFRHAVLRIYFINVQSQGVILDTVLRF